MKTYTDKAATALISFISLEEIRRRYSPGPGRHWFDSDTLRAFRCRLPQYGFQGPGGVFFVSSEQFKPSFGKARQRRYTVRQLTEDGIETVGEFNQLSRSTAERLARKCAAFGTESVVLLRDCKL